MIDVQSTLAEPWWIKPLIFFLGALLTFILTIIREIILDRRKQDRIKKAILQEIESNLQYGNEFSDFAFSDTIFKANISNLSCFNPKLLAKIIKYYLLIDQHRSRHNEEKQKGLEQEHTNKTWSIWEEIKKLGEEISSGQ